MNGYSDWSYKDPEYKKKIRAFNKKLKKNKKKKSRNKSFYDSHEWKKLRYRVLRKYLAECMCCGRSKKKHGIIIHVDHIKPISKYPNLKLCFENLQVLCEDCNLGKSNTDDIDWRPDEVEAELLDSNQLESLQGVHI